MTFENLESWQQARQLTREIYNLTRTGALAKDFGLCSQIQRAGVSIMSNIAEGSTESCRSKIGAFLSSIFHLLSPI